MIEKKRFENIDILSKYQRVVDRVKTVRYTGKVHRVLGMTIESIGPDVGLGDICRIRMGGRRYLYCEVTGFRDDKVVLMPFGDITGLNPGAMVSTTGQSLHVTVGDALLGRVIDGIGNPMDGRGQVFSDEEYPVEREAMSPIYREPIRRQLGTGIKAIDGLLSIGRGQRIGIFSGSGVGKSTLLGMIARYTDADINVIGLIGERGKEVRDFIDKELGPEGLKKSVLVVATGNQPPMVRIRGAFVATAIAEYFRYRGLNVNLLMDSITRFAHAQREVGVSSGEATTRGGYTSSVFAGLPRLLERAGNAKKGSITGIYTVLVDADDMNEPISDAVRGILDGHIVLSRSLAEQGHYPAIDVLASVSRSMNDVISVEHRQAALKIKQMMAIYKQYEDLVMLGEYQAGTNPALDEAIACRDRIVEFLRQDIESSYSVEDVRKMVLDLGLRADVAEKSASADPFAGIVL